MISPNLNVQTYGHGFPLVLLHGWGLHSEVWQPWAEFLAAHYQLIMIDLPGHGFSRMLPWSFSFEDLSLVLSHNLPTQCHVLGWSLGGLCALKLAHDYPHTVQKLILIATNPQFVQDPTWPYGMNPTDLQSFGLQLQQNYAKTIQRFLSLQCLGNIAMKTQLTQLKARFIQRAHPQDWALEAGLNILNHTNARPWLGHIQQPSLLIYGAQDRLVPPGAGEYAAQHIPQAELHYLKTAAHAPFLSHGTQVSHLIHDFLKKN